MHNSGETLYTGAALRRRRTELGLELADVAEAVGAGAAYIQDLEEGKASPTAMESLAIIRLLYPAGIA